MGDFFVGYYILYSFFFIIILLDLIGGFFNRKLLYLKFQDFFLFLFLIAFYILLANRSVNVGADTERYVRHYENMIYHGGDVYGSDFGFNILNKLLIYINVSPQYYLFFLSLLFVVPVYYAFKKFENVNKVYLLWFFSSLFIFISMSTNVLRQGIGGAFIMLGVSLYLNNKNNSKRFIIPFLIAPFFHFSCLLAVFVFFTSKYVSDKIVYLILFLSILLSYLGFNLNTLLVNLPIVGGLFLDRMDGYLNDNIKGYKTGFRIDFLIFNLFFIILGYYISRLKGVSDRYKKYNFVYRVYVLLTSYFIMMFNIPFSDRFGILSWIFIPFLIYPIYEMNNLQYYKLKLFSVCLGFSLFLIFNVIGV
ncbi:hypothetical protein GN157_07880 [Flavobacterium rakeshii]|uniref:EpsG family protein n=1 Tax=Flavobacterium rakeshii TaxID=1038845 RepID=A0A6N8HEK0_9FLAO|nr:EpsG family protein [Flavobacterium rakeshii]MUV03627.1 hypothetical protein [Flavobacterium rakeshii]